MLPDWAMTGAVARNAARSREIVRGMNESARRGSPEFFDLLHSGQECVALDFASSTGRTHLRRLLTRADIVIESSRPRALAQLGVRHVSADPADVDW